LKLLRERHRAMNDQEALDAADAADTADAAAASTAPAPDLAPEESAEGAATEEDVAARVTLEPASSSATVRNPLVIFVQTIDPVSGDLIKAALADVRAYIAQSRTALNDAEAALIIADRFVFAARAQPETQSAAPVEDV
jgi:hypothetical protein